MNLLVKIVLISSILNFASGLNCYSCTKESDILSCGKEYGVCPSDVDFCAKIIMKDPYKTSVIKSCAKRATSDHLGRTPGCYNGKSLHNIPFFDELETVDGRRDLIEFEMICICDTDGCNGSALLKPISFIAYLGCVGVLGILYKTI